MSAYDLTEFLRTAYRPFAYCVSSKNPLNTAYQKGGVTLMNGGVKAFDDYMCTSVNVKKGIYKLYSERK